MSLQNEPVAVATFVRVLLYAAVAFGFDITEEQLLAVIGVVEAASALFVRSKVSPVWKPSIEIPPEQA